MLASRPLIGTDPDPDEQQERRILVGMIFAAQDDGDIETVDILKNFLRARLKSDRAVPSREPAP